MIGRVLAVLAYLLMIGPIAVVLVEAFNGAELMTFPPEDWSVRWFAEFAANGDFIASFRVSIELALVAAATATVAGTLAALALGRSQPALETLLMAPLYVPRVLIGIALLLAFAVVRLNGTLAGLAIGHVLITLPFVIRAVAASLAGIDPATGEAARCLGARPGQVFFRVTLPQVRSGVAAGAVFAFIVSFSDVYLAIFVSGPDTITLPLRIFTFMEWEQTPMIAAVSAVQVAFILVVLLAAEKLVGLSRIGSV
jgi:putative spermidine/putrescine transport system permease protein